MAETFFEGELPCLLHANAGRFCVEVRNILRMERSEVLSFSWIVSAGLCAHQASVVGKRLKATAP